MIIYMNKCNCAICTVRKRLYFGGKSKREWSYACVIYSAGEPARSRLYSTVCSIIHIRL